jgi:hypothetical protein
MASPYAASPYVLSLLLLVLSVPAVFLLVPRLIPPRTLPAIPNADETEDLALFRRGRCFFFSEKIKTTWTVGFETSPRSARVRAGVGLKRVGSGF